ncbi:MAG: hypothetical protein E4H33_02440 [Anaerolineales bacterium]|nr:MAG: hypothetical protein E4H33_02440 [Anaerolineales bacterium]
MNRKNKLSGIRVGLIFSLIAAMLNLIFLGGASLRQKAAEQLELDHSTLEENFTQLEKVNQDQLDALRADLEIIQAEVVELEASFPELGAPFDVFSRGLELAQASQLDLISIYAVNSELQETASGILLFEEYDLELNGSLINCLTFIEKIETAGLDSVVMQSAGIFPADGICSLEIKTMGYPSSLQ